MYPDWLRRFVPTCFAGLEDQDLPPDLTVSHGKVRDIVHLGSELLVSASDRVSAFDRVLALVPCKGEVLTRTSLFWFSETRHIVDNHIREMVTPRTIRVERADVVPVEVVVRGYLSGSAWRDYTSGRPVSGITLPPGLRWNDALPEPLVTPSTKAAVGHDEPISERDIVQTGIVPARTWEKIRETALALYRFGHARAAAAGLILVDTKYEFGLRSDGSLLLIDELHTPDSSRYWQADTYAQSLERGVSPYHLDKEFLRAGLLEQGFRGDGTPPEIAEKTLLELAGRYIEAAERLTGSEFEPMAEDPDREIDRIVALAQEFGVK